MQEAIDILDEMIKDILDIPQSAFMGDRGYTVDKLKKAKSRIQALGDGWIPVTEKNPIGKCIAIRMSEGGEYFVNAWFSESTLDGWMQDDKGYTTTIDKSGATHWKSIGSLLLPPKQ